MGTLAAKGGFLCVISPVMVMAILLLLLRQPIPSVEGHGYLATPRSRNVYAQEETNWIGNWDENDPMPENCMQCLAGKSSGGCGITGQNNYDLPKNALGGTMKANTQATYAVGQEIMVDVVLTAHHKGHFVFSGCPISHGEIPSQECFDKHQLTFVEDMIHGANYDPSYPERAYVAPSEYPNTNQYYSFKMRLPSSLSGDLVLIQWYYLTANSCIHKGYLEYNWPNSWDYDLEGMDRCIDELGAEKFWNCAEVKIEVIEGGGNINHSIKDAIKKKKNSDKNNQPSGRKKKPNKKKPTGKKKQLGRRKSAGTAKKRKKQRDIHKMKQRISTRKKIQGQG